MWDSIKALIATRGVQLLSRYAGVGLTWLAAQAHLTPQTGEVDTTATFVASLVGAAVCFVIDHFSHSEQKA